MLERLLLVVALTIAVAAVSVHIRRTTARRMAGTQGRTVPAALRHRFAPGSSAILYFYGPHCAACAQQARALDRLQQELGCSVVRVDAVREPAASDELSILTVPATVVVGPDQKVRSINLGYREEASLRRQLAQSG